MGYRISDFIGELFNDRVNADDFFEKIKKLSGKSHLHYEQARMMGMKIISMAAEQNDDGLLHAVSEAINNYSGASATFIISKKDNLEVVQAGYLMSGVKLVFANDN